MASGTDTSTQKVGATHVTTAAEGGSGPTVFPPFNTETFAPQLVWLAISFGLLYVVLSRTILPRISSVLADRRGRIQRDLDEAERLKSETDRAIADYEAKLSDARGRAGTIARDTREKLAAEVDTERHGVEAALAKQLANAEARIGEMKVRALGEITTIASDTAGQIVSKLLGTGATADEVEAALSVARPKEA